MVDHVYRACVCDVPRAYVERPDRFMIELMSAIYTFKMFEMRREATTTRCEEYYILRALRPKFIHLHI